MLGTLLVLKKKIYESGEGLRSWGISMSYSPASHRIDLGLGLDLHFVVLVSVGLGSGQG